MAYRTNDQSRLNFALGAAIVHVLLGYLLLVGLGVPIPQKIAETLTMINIRPVPPAPEKKVAAAAKSPNKSEAPAKASLRAKATPAVAPPPPVKIVAPPPPVVAAPVSETGYDPRAGASDRPGPGTGAGGNGEGLGGGDGGDGGWTPSRRVSGKIKDSDYPRWAQDAGIGGTTYVHFIVSPQGLVDRCRTTRSSGNRELDDLTCDLIMDRFRYKPARDASGRPVADEYDGEETWEPRE